MEDGLEVRSDLSTILPGRNIHQSRNFVLSAWTQILSLCTRQERFRPTCDSSSFAHSLSCPHSFVTFARQVRAMSSPVSSTPVPATAFSSSCPCAMMSYFTSAELLDSSKSPLGFATPVVPAPYSRWHSEQMLKYLILVVFRSGILNENLVDAILLRRAVSKLKLGLRI